MFVADGGDGTLVLETERERAPALARKLSLYKLRSKVTVEDRSATTEVAVVFGPGAEALLPLEGTVGFVDPRLASLGVHVLAATGRVAQLMAARGIAAAPVDEASASPAAILWRASGPGRSWSPARSNVAAKSPPSRTLSSAMVGLVLVSEPLCDLPEGLSRTPES